METQFDPRKPEHVERMRDHIEGQLTHWAVQAVQCGFVPTITLGPPENQLCPGSYSITVDVRLSSLFYRDEDFMKAYNEWKEKQDAESHQPQ